MLRHITDKSADVLYIRGCREIDRINLTILQRYLTVHRHTADENTDVGRSSVSRRISMGAGFPSPSVSTGGSANMPTFPAASDAISRFFIV